MNKEKRFPTGIIVLLVIGLMLALAAKVVINKAQESKSKLDLFGEVPDFNFTGHNGESFGRNDLNDKVTVVNFFFTSCKNVCPVMNGKMQGLYETFKAYDRIQFVSISVDPDNDTLEVLQKYAESFGVNDLRWMFLRAPVEDVIELSEKGFALPCGNLPMGHSRKLVLVDFDGNIRGYYDSFDDMKIAMLKVHIAELYYQAKDRDEQKESS